MIFESRIEEILKINNQIRLIALSQRKKKICQKTCDEQIDDKKTFINKFKYVNNEQTFDDIKLLITRFCHKFECHLVTKNINEINSQFVDIINYHVY